MRFFDCNLCFGPAMAPPLRQSVTRDQLLEEMDFCGTSEALVYHVSQREGCPSEGNRTLLVEIGNDSRLTPVWVILPPQTEELGTAEQFLAAMRQNRVRALRAFPTQHRFQLNGATFGALFEELTAQHIPLLLDGEWEKIETLLGEFPKLTVIAHQMSQHGQDRAFRPLVEKYSNFHLSTTRYELAGGLASFVRKYGPERLVYGSGYPDVCLGGGMLMLRHAAISDADKEKIAGGNLRRLLAEVKL